MKKGRPTGYKPEFARQARIYCRLGAETRDLASFFSVSTATLYRWLDRYPDFGLAVALGQADHAGSTKPGMFKRGTGYIFRAERVFRVNSATPLAADYDYRVPADAGVALRWLRIRQPDKWRIKPPRTPD